MKWRTGLLYLSRAQKIGNMDSCVVSANFAIVHLEKTPDKRQTSP
jgi:hypothetical protein